MWFCHVWGWQPTQTASPIHIRQLQTVWVHWYAVHWHTVAFLNSYPPYLAQILCFWVTCGVEIMLFHHCWGWQPPQTASRIHNKHLKSVWVHWYAVHRHMVVALHSYTHPTWLRFWGTWSLVESKWCNYIKVDADSHLKLLPTSIWDINKCLSTLICCP